MAAEDFTTFIPYEALSPNPWNPNEMGSDMFAKERASIRDFGFIDPLTVREVEAGVYEIIDGEHRWKAGRAEGMTRFPCVVVEADEEQAKALTLILNDLRGEMREDKLAAVIKDLAERRDAAWMQRHLPYDRSRIEQLRERRQIDWSELEGKRPPPVSRKRKDADTDPWVERVYRLPRSSAQVIDEAVQKVQNEDDVDQDWRALEFIAADFLGK